MKFKFITAPLLGLLMTVNCLSNIARADLINIEVKGGAALIDPALAPYFNIGDEMTLRFNMDLDVIGFENASFSSNNQLSPMEFSIGTYNGTVASYRPSITNGPNCTFVCGDVWAAEGKNEFGTSFNFPTFGNYYLDIVHLEYRDDKGAALNTANMASSISQLSNFSNWALSLYFKNTQDPSAQRVSVTALNPTVTIIEVPAPSTLTIFALGFICLAVRRFNKQS
jgi:hypothetical protein